LKFLDIDGSIILKLITTECDGMHWIDLSHDRSRRQRALVNAVMNLRTPQNAGNFLIS
jgi:hypothetical protein